jgi:hypothetical protein
VKQFVFQYVTWIESYKPFKYNFNLESFCILIVDEVRIRKC